MLGGSPTLATAPKQRSGKLGDAQQFRWFLGGGTGTHSYELMLYVSDKDNPYTRTWGRDAVGKYLGWSGVRLVSDWEQVFVPCCAG